MFFSPLPFPPPPPHTLHLLMSGTFFSRRLELVHRGAISIPLRPRFLARFFPCFATGPRIVASSHSTKVPFSISCDSTPIPFRVENSVRAFRHYRPVSRSTAFLESPIFPSLGFSFKVFRSRTLLILRLLLSPFFKSHVQSRKLVRFTAVDEGLLLHLPRDPFPSQTSAILGPLGLNLPSLFRRLFFLETPILYFAFPVPLL